MESGGTKLSMAASLFYKANYHDIGRWKTKLLGLYASCDIRDWISKRAWGRGLASKNLLEWKLFYSTKFLYFKNKMKFFFKLIFLNIFRLF